MNRAPAGAPYSTGSQTPSTLGSAAARRAISGPMPAGSPSVIAMRGFIRYSYSILGARGSKSSQWQLQLPPLAQPPLPQPLGLSQPPSLPQPPCTTPLALGSSYRRQHLRRPQSPDSLDGFRLSSCCLAILIDTGSNDVRNVVQQSGRPHVP